MRFTIRELVLVTVIAALGVSWWLDRTHSAARAAELEARAVDLQSKVAEHQNNVLKLERTVTRFEDYLRHLHMNRAIREHPRDDRKRKIAEAAEKSRADTIIHALKREGRRTGIEPD
jgi:hypothetical protein